MKTKTEKPIAKLVGANGNVFNLMGICARALRANGQGEKTAELIRRVTTSKSYDDALVVMQDYVEIR